MKTLMVCLGNICRSPLAEGILRHKLNQKIGKTWSVASAGTAAYYHINESPYHLSIAVATKYGFDISTQRSQQFTAEHIHLYDKIYVMDKENYADVQQIAANDFDKSKVCLIRSLVNSPPLEVPDPYQKPIEAFESVYHILDEACDAIINQYATT